MTHDQDEALSVADRVVLLDAGRIVAEGTPEALWTHPPNAWSARFLGFRNVALARVAGGVIETPWGRLAGPHVDAALADGPAVVVLRPAAIVREPTGAIRGRVISRRFRGDHVLLLVAAGEGPPLHVEARECDLPAVGEEVRLDVRAGGVHLIAEPSRPTK